MYQDLQIIDFHLHFPTTKPMMGEDFKRPESNLSERRRQITREHAKAYNTDWRLAWDFPPPQQEKQSDEELADRWAGEVDRYGLRAVGFTTGGGNDNLAKIVQRYPDKFIGFAHHNPFAKNAADELRRAVKELGLKAYKLLGPGLDGSIADPALYPVWEVCAELEIPVLIHFGIMGAGGGIAWHENINPLVLNPVARDFPDVTFVVPHFGCGWVRETLMLCWACRNVVIDTSGSNQWVRWVEFDWDLEKLFRKYMETIGPERIVFGTDSSWFPRGFAIRYLQDQIRAARNIGMTHEQLQMVFGGNAARMFKIDL